MTTITIVGSGPCGSHLALSLLERGQRVRLLDVGRRGPAPPLGEASFSELKDRLEDPVEYLLGAQLEGILDPEAEDELYGIPPSKAHVVERESPVSPRSRGFSPLGSLALGGLANAWTGNCYAYNDAELDAFPFAHAEIAPFYEQVANRIGISGAPDDFAHFIPDHGPLEDALDLDDHAAGLMSNYRRHRARINRGLGGYMGRSRIAVRSSPPRDPDPRDAMPEARRGACTYLGRCLWGCPVGALYTPAMTLARCLEFDTFEYLADHEVHHFVLDIGARVRKVVVAPPGAPSSRRVEINVDVLALAAGTLATARIYLESMRRSIGERVRLPGLMDNRQVLVPFVSPAMLARAYRDRSYQYNLLALELEMEHPSHLVHCQLTTLKSAMTHPIIASLPVDLRTGVEVFRVLHAALGLANVNFHDERRAGSLLELDEHDRAVPRLVARYVPPPGESERIATTLARLRRILRLMGAFAVPGMAKARTMGSSVHYAGTLPMSRAPRAHAVRPDGRCHEIDNLYIADGSAFPFLPAKNLTFTLMANAARIASLGLGRT